MKGIVFDIKEFAVYDGPGIRTTVFMKGCPLHCQWCHNPEGLSTKPELMVSRAACVHCGACERVCKHSGGCIACGECISACRGNLRKIVGTEWSAEALAARLQKDCDVYALSGGGVTFSGGEPLMQWPFVSEVIDRLEGISVAVETSGYAPDEIFDDALHKCNLIMMDWKVSDPVLHKKYTGVSQERIRTHLEKLVNSSVPFILRMPIIPSVNDRPEHFRAAADLVKKSESLIRIDVLPYQRAAGAKYEMVGRKYAPDFDESTLPTFFTEIFDELDIKYQDFSGTAIKHVRNG